MSHNFIRVQVTLYLFIFLVCNKNWNGLPIFQIECVSCTPETRFYLIDMGCGQACSDGGMSLLFPRIRPDNREKTRQELLSGTSGGLPV